MGSRGELYQVISVVRTVTDLQTFFISLAVDTVSLLFPYLLCLIFAQAETELIQRKWNATEAVKLTNLTKV